MKHKQWFLGKIGCYVLPNEVAESGWRKSWAVRVKLGSVMNSRAEGPRKGCFRGCAESLSSPYRTQMLHWKEAIQIRTWAASKVMNLQFKISICDPTSQLRFPADPRNSKDSKLAQKFASSSHSRCLTKSFQAWKQVANVLWFCCC